MRQPDQRRRYLPQLKGIVSIYDGEIHHDAGVGNEKYREPDELQPGLLAKRQILADQIDTHVGVPDIAVAKHQCEQPGVEVPLQFLQQRRAEKRADVLDQPDLLLAEQLAYGHVVSRDQHQG
jgi:hypothetical protein